MIDAKYVHKLLECKYDFKHWIKDVISSFGFKDGIDYISYRYDNNGEQIIDNNSHVFRRDYYLFPKSLLCIIYMKCDRSLFKDFIYDIFDCCNIKNEDWVLDITHRFIGRHNKKCIKYFTYIDTHRAKIEACESILEDINPAFKQTREQDRKIAGIENKVNDLTDSFEDLKKLIVERLK